MHKKKKKHVRTIIPSFHLYFQNLLWLVWFHAIKVVILIH